MLDNSHTNILTVNAGSSSIKFSVYKKNTFALVAEGAIENMDMDGTFISIQNNILDETFQREIIGDPVEALLETLTKLGVMESLAGVGHRVVHGGQEYFEPTPITEKLLVALEVITAYAPQHLPTEIALIRKFTKLLPDIPHIACFDTAFHHTMPENAQLLPLPSVYRESGVRRYGFHGLSCEHLLEVLETTYDVPVNEKSIVLAHLGSGASLTAVRKGVSIDTTMGFTPNSGLPMSTRTGDIDAGLFQYFTENIGMTHSEFNHLINFESGLLAISGTTADMKVLLEQAETDEASRVAVSYFAYQVRKQIGAMVAAMGGIDILVFTGGIGERSAKVRSQITSELRFLGIEINETANNNNENRISKIESSVSVYRIPANEGRTIAKHVAHVLDALSIKN